MLWSARGEKWNRYVSCDSKLNLKSRGERSACHYDSSKERKKKKNLQKKEKKTTIKQKTGRDNKIVYISFFFFLFEKVSFIIHLHVMKKMNNEPVGFTLRPRISINCMYNNYKRKWDEEESLSPPHCQSLRGQQWGVRWLFFFTNCGRRETWPYDNLKESTWQLFKTKQNNWK